MSSCCGFPLAANGRHQGYSKRCRTMVPHGTTTGSVGGPLGKSPACLRWTRATGCGFQGEDHEFHDRMATSGAVYPRVSMSQRARPARRSSDPSNPMS